ncbi:Long-chain fatty alcohol dehydrogenase family protein [Prunus dulcis]|uniref:Long-chain fatty alcohol dehydrogenase family protein n=1 Tax=Prunus dulcis TaxID=3755 RepID=A0A4Y1RKB2_PRUDU|nr:Long-chain fatty alcohol dehydrogenase family protein [Prunus dulcis]
MTLSSRWKILNKELGKWRDALAKAMDNHRSEENLSNGIILTGPAVVLNETPLRDSTTSNSPLNSPMSQDSPIEKEPRPIGRKAAKAKKAGNLSNNNSKFLEEIVRQNAIRIEMEQKHQENEMAIQAEYVREREYLPKKAMYKTDR